ncbi:MAG: nickel pincer cofactor biosynthesis protein LarB [Candidatus Chisholmbacteria bacterium]|nr:nickel pincer cofactor biosynthesis protein LarB [Candidatus Chisholmbacteria bacterium]
MKLSLEQTDTRPDYDRLLRLGMPEFVYAESKTPDQVVKSLRALFKTHKACLAYRATQAQFRAVKKSIKSAQFNALARIIRCGKMSQNLAGKVVVVSGGTSDVPVVAEAVEVLEFLGCKVRTLQDVGVSGIHRLQKRLSIFSDAQVTIVVAGMEGSLPTVIAGFVKLPIIAVPTSVGFGANLGGITTLLSMLTSCAPGVAVVNVNNGVGAALASYRILNTFKREGA